jgi:hypothetical protein
LGFDAFGLTAEQYAVQTARIRAPGRGQYRQLRRSWGGRLATLPAQLLHHDVDFYKDAVDLPEI